jgi:septal ring factor EnvC (AmiA/AmiB activator)
MLTERRIQQLADNIRQDLDLLKAYEDKLRYETDLRRLEGYRREIERQRESLTRYQQEYDELQKQVTGEPSAEMVDTADLLRQMDAKLDNIQRGQKVMQDDLKDLRKTLLARFDASEQTIISAIVQRLDQNQLAIVQSILDEIGTHSVPENELQETLSALQQTLLEIRETEIGLYDSQLMTEAKRLSEMVDDPKLDLTHKLKVSIPIIPLILSYETEVELKSGLNLKTAWQRLKARVRGER